MTDVVAPPLFMNRELKKVPDFFIDRFRTYGFRGRWERPPTVKSTMTLFRI